MVPAVPVPAQPALPAPAPGLSRRDYLLLGIGIAIGAGGVIAAGGVGWLLATLLRRKIRPPEPAEPPGGSEPASG